MSRNYVTSYTNTCHSDPGVTERFSDPLNQPAKDPVRTRDGCSSSALRAASLGLLWELCMAHPSAPKSNTSLFLPTHRIISLTFGREHIERKWLILVSWFNLLSSLKIIRCLGWTFSWTLPGVLVPFWETSVDIDLMAINFSQWC